MTPNGPYRGRTAPLNSERCILYIYSTNIGTKYFKHGIHSAFISLQNVVSFIILTYLVPVLFSFYLQGVLKLKKKLFRPQTFNVNFRLLKTIYFKHCIYSAFISLQNVVCFIILTYLVPLLFSFYVQGVLKLKKKLFRRQKVNVNFRVLKTIHLHLLVCYWYKWRS